MYTNINTDAAMEIIPEYLEKVELEYDYHLEALVASINTCTALEIIPEYL